MTRTILCLAASALAFVAASETAFAQYYPTGAYVRGGEFSEMDPISRRKTAEALRRAGINPAIYGMDDLAGGVAGSGVADEISSRAMEAQRAAGVDVVATLSGAASLPPCGGAGTTACRPAANPAFLDTLAAEAGSGTPYTFARNCVIAASLRSAVPGKSGTDWTFTPDPDAGPRLSYWQSALSLAWPPGQDLSATIGEIADRGDTFLKIVPVIPQGRFDPGAQYNNPILRKTETACDRVMESAGDPRG